MKIVKNLNTLKAMQRLGFIKFHHQTGEQITGLYSSKKFTCYYVDDGKYFFTYKGKKYGTTYISGCFCPYVVELNS